MPNITFSIDDALLRKSKSTAAKTGVSLNAVVRTLLKGFAENAGESNGMSGNYLKLLDFSLGRVSYRTLMKELAVEGDEQLFLLMARAGLPMPSLSEEETKAMADKFGEVLKSAGV